MNRPTEIRGEIRNMRELSRDGDAYRFLFSETDLAVFVIAEEVEDCNAAACRLLGRERDEIVGHSPLEFTPPTQPDGTPSDVAARERLGSALAGLPQWCRWQFRRPDGTPVDTFAYVETIRVDGARRVLLRMRDVSALEQAEAVLKETETRLQQILDNTSTAVVFAKDLAGRYLFVNRAFERILGIPQGEIVGRTTDELFQPDVAAALRANDLRVVIGRHKIEVEEQVTVRGETRWLLSNKFPLFNRDGEPYAVCGIAADITDRKRTEDTLRKAALAVSGAGGEQGLQGLAGALCEILEADVALVSVFADPEHVRMRTLAAVLDGKQLRSYDYLLAESPCAGLVGRDFRFVESGARHEIPPGTMFHAKGMDSYAAYALADSTGTPIGLIAVMNRTPMHDADRVEAVLKIFAVRAAAEIERLQTEEALRSAALAVSSAAGEAVFPELVRALAAILDVEVAFIALPVAGDPSRLRVLALRVDGRMVDGFEYPVAGTPCETVLGQTYRAYPARLGELFPLDGEFGRLRLASYAGLPLADARGESIGIISVASRKPLANPERAEAMLKIFAARAVTEIERARADAALRAAEVSYRAIFEAAEDPIFVHDWDTGAVIDVNPKACEVYGYSYEELKRISIDEVSSGEHPYTSAEATRWIERAKSAGSVEFEWHRRNRDGSLHWDEVRLKSAVIGGERRVLAFVREITERKLAEERLRASEEQYRAIFNASDDALVLWDSSLRRVDVNPAYERIYGFTREEVIGNVYAENLPPQYAEKRRELARRTLAGEPCSVELESVRKDGERIQVEVRTIPIQHRGEPHVLAISRDVTERRRAEAAVRASEEQYRSIFNASVDGMLLWDADHRIVDVNEAFLRMHGYRREDFVGETRPVFILGELQTQCETLLPQILAGKPCHIEARSQRKDGTGFDVEIHGVPMHYRGQPHVFVILRDVTARREAEERLRASEQRYRLLFEMESDAILLVDAETLQLLDANRAAAELYGCSRDELLRMKAADISVEPAETAAAIRGHSGTMRIPLRYHRKKDGTVFPVEISSNLLELGGRRILLAAIRDITERKRAEEKLRESEERYRLLFEMESDAIVVVDVETQQYLDVNRAAVELYGYDREELLRLKAIDLSAEPDQTRAVIGTGAAGSGAAVTQVPLRHHRKKDGTVFPVEITANFFDLDGRRIGVAAIRDITERQTREEVLRKSEEQYRAIFNASLDGMLIRTLAGEVVDVNPALLAMYGYARGEIVGKNPSPIISAENVESFRTFLAEVGAGRPYRTEAGARRKDGSEFVVDAFGSPVTYRGSPHILSVVRDITERKRAEEKLRESEERYRLLFEMESDAIVVVDVETLQHLDVNRAAAEMYGYSREELLRLRSTDVSAEPEDTSTAMRAGGSLPGIGVVRVPLRHHRRRDGTVFPVEITANFFDLDGRRIMVAAIRDITERRRAEEERSRLEEQLRQAQKMEAIGHLTGGIAHDFNNILTSILGYIVLGEERQASAGDAKLGRYLGQARLAAQRARDLIQQMLTFSRGKRGERRALALPPLVMESVKLLRSTLPATIELETAVEGAVPPVMMDPVQIEQVLLNLCINARDAMGSVGQITVGARLVDAGETPCASCRQPAAGRFVELWVRDTGPGIAPEVLERMFEPFFTTKEVGRGSGMGLAMVHGIVHDHGGHIVVDTSAGAGTVFRLRFAAAGAAGAGAEPAAPGGDTAAQRRPQLSGRVLLVDDEQMVGEFMAELLGNWGLDVVVKRNPVEAEAWFTREPDRVDLVLTDQTMPKLTGLELAARITAERPRLPVILYTGYDDNITESDLSRCGVRTLIRKPVEPEALFAALCAHLSGRAIETRRVEPDASTASASAPTATVPAHASPPGSARVAARAGRKILQRQPGPRTRKASAGKKKTARRR